MALGYKFKAADRRISCLRPGEYQRLVHIAGEIQAAQRKLLDAGTSHFHRCRTRCKGLCCRNVDLDAIIGMWDFVFLLTVERGMKAQLAACLARETPFFSSDCVFLENGVGPCVLPAASRPEVCITAFCMENIPLDREIRRVKQAFLRLSLFMQLRSFRLWQRFFTGNKQAVPPA